MDQEQHPNTLLRCHQLNIQQIGAGAVTIQGASGVTITSTGATATAPVTRAQYSAASIIRIENILK